MYMQYKHKLQANPVTYSWYLAEFLIKTPVRASPTTIKKSSFSLHLLEPTNEESHSPWWCGSRWTGAAPQKTNKRSEFTTKLSPEGETAALFGTLQEEEEEETDLGFTARSHTRSPCFCWSRFDLLTFKASLVCLLSLRTDESRRAPLPPPVLRVRGAGPVCRRSAGWTLNGAALGPLKCDFLSFFF